MRFNKSSYLKILAKSAAVAGAFTPEKYDYILSLLPTPQSYRELHDRLQATSLVALREDPEKVKAREADREAVERELSILKALAKAVALKDPNVPEMLDLGDIPKKTAARTVILTAPQRFKVFHGRDGRLFASLARVMGAKSYEIWANAGDPSDEANEMLIASSSHCKNIPLTRLNRATGNWLRAIAKRGHVAGPWSAYVHLPPL